MRAQVAARLALLGKNSSMYDLLIAIILKTCTDDDVGYVWAWRVWQGSGVGVRAMRACGCLSFQY